MKTMLKVTVATLMSSVAALGMVAASSDGANAQSLNNGWSYQYDAIGDGSGGSKYDIKGMAMSVQGDKLFVALTGGTPLAGVKDRGALGGSIGWGDLFFNFSGKNFNDAAAAGQLFGVRFASANDSKVGLGVYSGVSTTSVAVQNDGYRNLDHYYTASKGAFNKQNTQGTAIATRAAANSYYGATGSIQNVIASGNKVGNVNLLTAQALSTLGLSFSGSAAKDNTFGFSFDRGALPGGSFLASLFLECGNDAIAFSGSSAAAPEPTTMAGAALGIAAIGGLKRARRRKESAAS
jgi:hypothetical protein